MNKNRTTTDNLKLEIIKHYLLNHRNQHNLWGEKSKVIVQPELPNFSPDFLIIELKKIGKPNKNAKEHIEIHIKIINIKTGTLGVEDFIKLSKDITYLLDTQAFVGLDYTLDVLLRSKLERVGFEVEAILIGELPSITLDLYNVIQAIEYLDCKNIFIKGYMFDNIKGFTLVDCDFYQSYEPTEDELLKSDEVFSLSEKEVLTWLKND